MRLYQCRDCTAIYTSPSGPSCPACGHGGPTVVDASNDNSYTNNWYAPLQEELGG